MARCAKRNYTILQWLKAIEYSIGHVLIIEQGLQRTEADQIIGQFGRERVLLDLVEVEPFTRRDLVHELGDFGAQGGAGQPRHRRRIDARQQDIAHPLLVLGAGAAIGKVDDALERLIDRDEFAPARFDNPAPETVRSHLKILHQPRRSEERPDNSPDKAAMPSVKRLRRSAATEPAPAAALNRCGWNGRNYWWNCGGLWYSAR